MMTEQLKPCPFCGGDAQCGWRETGDDGGGEGFVECLNCPVDMCSEFVSWIHNDEKKRQESTMEAIHAWNTRARPAAPAVDIEALKHERDTLKYWQLRNLDAIMRAVRRAEAAEAALESSRAVRTLVWENIGRCVGWSADREDTHLHTATELGRLYEVALGKDGWWAKWQGAIHARGRPTAEAAKAAAQADYEARILAAMA